MDDVWGQVRGGNCIHLVGCSCCCRFIGLRCCVHASLHAVCKQASHHLFPHCRLLSWRCTPRSCYRSITRLLSCHHLTNRHKLPSLLQVTELEVHAQELLIGVPVEGEMPDCCSAATRAAALRAGCTEGGLHRGWAARGLAPGVSCFPMPQNYEALCGQELVCVAISRSLVCGSCCRPPPDCHLRTAIP